MVILPPGRLDCRRKRQIENEPQHKTLPQTSAFDNLASRQRRWPGYDPILGSTERGLAMPADSAMIALSIRQPYAEQIMTGEKEIEYRQQRTKIRGRIYVYACKTASIPDEYREAGLRREDLPHGVLVGTVEIVDCVEGSGEFEWLLANPKRLQKPMPVTAMPQPVFFWPFGKPESAR